MMSVIRDEIAAVREDVIVLRGRIQRILEFNQINSSRSKPEAMETEQQDNLPVDQMNIDHPHIEDANIMETRPPHADFLDDCFLKRIGLSPSSRQKVDITTFDGVLVAKGYNRIIPT